MFRRLLGYAGAVGVALLHVLCFGCHSPQGWSEGLTFEWNPTRPSPDTRLVLRQVRQRTVSGKTCVEYELMSEGFPSDMPAALWMRHGAGYRWATATVGDDGDVDVLGGDHLIISGYLKGQPLEVALECGGLQAYARDVPHPIRATSGARSLDVELIGEAGTAFRVMAGGFEPGEPVLFTSAYGDQAGSQTVVADDEGGATLELVFPSGRAGRATATVAGSGDTLSVEHYFGKYVRTGTPIAP
jgi:hypothetical protein